MTSVCARGLAATVDLPAITRLYNALAGGRWANRTEKEAAREIERRWPGTRRMLRHIRRYHAASAQAAAERGITGIVFACCGLPAAPSPHGRALRANPAVRYVYADPDDKTALITRAEYRDDPSVAVVTQSVRDPGKLLGTREVQALGGPLSLQIQRVAHFWPDAFARDLVAEYAALLPPGSSLVLTLSVPPDTDAGREFAARLAEVSGTPVYSHAPETVTGWLADAGLETRGAADVRLWDRREWGETLPEPPSGTALAAVGHKPR